MLDKIRINIYQDRVVTFFHWGKLDNYPKKCIPIPFSGEECGLYMRGNRTAPNNIGQFPQKSYGM
jgi:hypothetical protein